MKKILILELGGIGDVVMALPALKGLVDLYRNDDLKILTVERTLPIVEQIRYTDPANFKVESVYLLKKGGPVSWLGLIRRLKREGYDTVIDLSAIERYIAGVKRFLFLKLLSVSEVIGRNTDGHGWAYTKGIDETLTSSEHEVERKLRVAEVLGIKVSGTRPRIVIRDADRAWAGDFLKGLPEKGLVIGINPGAYRPSRMWSVERFKEIAQWLVEELSASLVVMGGEKERGVIEDISRGLPEEKVVQCVGLAIPRLAAVMDSLSLVVTNDTGSMHVAAAVDTPIVALFGQTNLGRYHPYMDADRYIAIKKDCTVCPHTSFRNPMEECRRYSCNSQECMQLISVNEVKSAVRALLKGLGDCPRGKRRRKKEKILRKLSTEAVKNKKASLGWICRKVRERAVKVVGEGGRILDLGCGNGLFLAMLGLKGFKKNRVMGIDLSPDLLNEAKTVFSSNGQEGIPLIKGDFFNTPFKDGTFESIVSLNTIINLEDVDLERLLKEMARVLSPSGRIYLDIRNGDNPFIRWRYLQSSRKRILLVRGYRLNEFVERLKSIGLNVSRIEYIGFKTKTLALAYLLEIRIDHF